MVVRVDVKIIQGKTLQKRMIRLKKDLENRVEPHRKAGKLLIQRIIQDVRAGRSPDGNRLQPLSGVGTRP